MTTGVTPAPEHEPALAHAPAHAPAPAPTPALQDVDRNTWPYGRRGRTTAKVSTGGKMEDNKNKTPPEQKCIL